ncbi:hypothetical protein D3C76_882820 [compost metagenome]
MGTGHALAATGAKAQRRGQAGRYIVQAFQCANQLLAAGVTADLLERFAQQAQRAQGIDLQRRLARVQALALLQPGEGGQALLGPVFGDIGVSQEHPLRPLLGQPRHGAGHLAGRGEQVGLTARGLQRRRQLDKCLGAAKEDDALPVHGLAVEGLDGGRRPAFLQQAFTYLLGRLRLVVAGVHHAQVARCQAQPSTGVARQAQQLRR